MHILLKFPQSDILPAALYVSFICFYLRNVSAFFASFIDPTDSSYLSLLLI